MPTSYANWTVTPHLLTLQAVWEAVDAPREGARRFRVVGNCLHCGAATTTGARFCAACGAVLQSAPSATAVTADREPRSLDRQVLRVALLVVLFFVVEVVAAELIAAVAGENLVGVAVSYLIAGAVTVYVWRSSRR